MILVLVPGAREAAAAGTPSPAAQVRVVVQGEPGAGARVAEAVHRMGGEVRTALAVVHGVAATVPSTALARLRATPGVRAVTPDGRVRFTGESTDGGGGTAPDFGTLHRVAEVVRAVEAWQAGYTGAGVDVALIDTGVSPVTGLTSGNVVNGPDLSFDSQNAALTNLDGYGHGTHMASIIAGRDQKVAPSKYADPSRWKGIAPDARIVSVKVGSADGATDVSQVIAAINWVTENAKRNGLNIRVLNLSFGTDSTQDWTLDPLSYAAEVAWRRGIVVVVAGGNDGSANWRLANPAQNPHLLAVGADDPRGTIDPADDVTPEFANRGSDKRHVDVVAPAVSVQGLRVPGSQADLANPAARVGDRFFRGTGTSQGAAVVSGLAALLLQRHPELTPEQVKAHLMDTAVSTLSEKKYRGKGVPDMRKALDKLPPKAEPKYGYGSGLGSLEKARGSAHVAMNGTALTGEQDVFGRKWSPATWAPAALEGTTWNGGTWNGTTWTGSSWTGSSWTSQTWAGSTWTGSSWTGSSWTGHTWTGNTWTGTGWSGSSWTGNSWTGKGWTSAMWAGASWS